MALTSAERQRRYRRHKAGDHGACDPDRCGGLGKQATAAARPRPRAAAPPEALREESGLAGILSELVSEIGPAAPPGHRALLLMARRLCARLDRLEAYLSGHEDVWLRLQPRNDDGSIVEVVIDAALAEARQHDMALRQVLIDLGKAVPAAPAVPGRSRRDDVAAQRAKRLAAARGVADAAGS